MYQNSSHNFKMNRKLKLKKNKIQIDIIIVLPDVIQIDRPATFLTTEFFQASIC